LGSLDANFFGGSVEVKNLHIRVDSNRYVLLKQKNQLPPLTLQLDLVKGRLDDIAIFPLLFGKKIRISQIISSGADIRLSRHTRKTDQEKTSVPLWKAMQPGINAVEIDRIRLDGVKLLYRHADTAESVKLQFDRCEGVFDNIRIDSASEKDPERLGFIRDMQIKFNDLKFRSPDSSFKLKAKWIYYSSKGKTLEVDSFKMQPTREDPKDFYSFKGVQASMDVYEIARVTMKNFDLRNFLNFDMYKADSITLDHPTMSIYLDRTYPPSVYRSKIGGYPHQRILRSKSPVYIGSLSVINGGFFYKEKNKNTQKEGTIAFTDVNMKVQHVTNDPARIKKQPFTRVKAEGKLFNTSPINLNVLFYLDSANGRFDATGSVKNVQASQLGSMALAVSSMQLSSFNLRQLQFSIRGEDFGARSDVAMLYDNFSVVMNKVDKETGAIDKSNFMTRVVNNHVFWPSNPGPDGVERKAKDVQVARTTTNTFFGLLWHALFAGMQKVMSK
jgi:hypothetical protein